MSHVREVARKSGKAYEVRWVDDGKARQRTFSQRREAERFAARVENTLAEGSTTAPLARQTRTVAEVVAASLAASEAKLKPRTFRPTSRGTPGTSSRRSVFGASRR